MLKPLKDELETVLVDASAAHHEYEAVTLRGARDKLWSGFYAAYVLGRLGDFAKPSDLSKWLEETPINDSWTSTAASYVLSRLDVE
jgi:hypothetical protein